MKPPTPNMLAVLRQLADPGNYASLMDGGRYEAPYYYLHSTMKRCTVAICGLLARGLVEWTGNKTYHPKIKISRAGRKYLKEHATEELGC